MEENKVHKDIMMPYGSTRIYSDVDGLSLQNLFFAKVGIEDGIGVFPSCQMFTTDAKSGDFRFDAKAMLAYLIETTPEDEDFEYVEYNTYNMTTKKERVGFCGVFKKSNLYFRVEKCVSESYILYKHGNEDKMKELIDVFSKFYVEPEPEKNNLWKLATTNSGYTLIKSKVKEVAGFNINKQYNDDIAKEDEKICNFIKEDNHGGLVILHGEKGTGKSTYIRHLINETETKKFVYVPASIVPLLGDPSFGTFLQTLANHIIILEDCENAIRDRRSGNGSSAAVSLILNMTDGLLEDDLGIKFICTFNEDVKNIDPALLRKGRLISKYEFKSLNVEKSNALLSELYSEKTDDVTGEVISCEAPQTTKAMTLADIYNYEEESYEEKKRSFI